MTTRSPRPTIDLSLLTPGTLDQLSDDDFRLVVDADIKKASSAVQPVPDWVSHELRGPAVDRWHMTLKRMHASVEHQLDAKTAEYEAEKARLRLQGEDIKLEELNVRHFQKRSQSLRFRSGLTDVLMEAEGLASRRASRLQEAIRVHRQALLDDNTTEPSPADLTLWAVLES
jgi:hypothetical protein